MIVPVSPTVVLRALVARPAAALLLSTSCAAALAPPASAQTTPPVREHYDAAYIGAPLADPVLQQAKETYVVFGCAYCHGVNLVPRGEATDLRSSSLVGRDVDGHLLAPLLRAGIPQTAKLSPMPQFSDLSDRQIADLVRWMHYARQEARYATITGGVPAPAGDAATGRSLFERSCRSCHDETALRAAAAPLDAATLTRAILKPPTLQGAPSWTVAALQDETASVGRARHGALLENATAQEVANLRAFLTTPGR